LHIERLTIVHDDERFDVASEITRRGWGAAPGARIRPPPSTAALRPARWRPGRAIR
jgi:hypothetical protein